MKTIKVVDKVVVSIANNIYLLHTIKYISHKSYKNSVNLYNHLIRESYFLSF